MVERPRDRSAGRPILRDLSWITIASQACLLPFLLHLPIYSDELQWKILSSRALVDEKLLYLFPVCEKGFRLDMPWTWYPLRFAEALVYQDLSNPYRLRYGGILMFVLLLVGMSMAIRRALYRTTPLVQVAGLACAAMTIGVMPFLAIFNRPEQGVLLALFEITGSAALLYLPYKKRSSWQSWALAAAFLFLICMALAAHIKSLFLVPAMLIAAIITIRRWLPSIVMLGGTAYAVYETFTLWESRTSCPESKFLTGVFRNLSLGPADLSEGIKPFLHKLLTNLGNISSYWERVSFRSDYQSLWLPDSASPLSFAERVVNGTAPLFIVIGTLCIVLALAIETGRYYRNESVHAEPYIGAALLAGLLGLAAYQTTKNFYEAALQAPVFILAVAFALPSLLRWNVPRRLLVWPGVALLVVATVSHALLAARFWVHLDEWRAREHAVRRFSAEVQQLAIRCGVPPDSRSARIMMDDEAYAGLWRTREPLLVSYWDGWWATGINQDKILEARNVSAIIARCVAIPERYRASAITSGDFCCKKLGINR